MFLFLYPYPFLSKKPKTETKNTPLKNKISKFLDVEIRMVVAWGWAQRERGDVVRWV